MVKIRRIFDSRVDFLCYHRACRLLHTPPHHWTEPKSVLYGILQARMWQGEVYRQSRATK